MALTRVPGRLNAVTVQKDCKEFLKAIEHASFLTRASVELERGSSCTIPLLEGLGCGHEGISIMEMHGSVELLKMRGELADVLISMDGRFFDLVQDVEGFDEQLKKLKVILRQVLAAVAAGLKERRAPAVAAGGGNGTGIMKVLSSTEEEHSMQLHSYGSDDIQSGVDAIYTIYNIVMRPHYIPSVVMMRRLAYWSKGSTRCWADPRTVKLLQFRVASTDTSLMYMRRKIGGCVARSICTHIVVYAYVGSNAEYTCSVSQHVDL